MQEITYHIGHLDGSPTERVGASELEQKIKDGTVTAETLLWRKEWPEWKKCGELPEFLSLLNAQEIPPPLPIPDPVRQAAPAPSLAGTENQARSSLNRQRRSKDDGSDGGTLKTSTGAILAVLLGVALGAAVGALIAGSKGEQYTEFGVISGAITGALVGPAVVLLYGPEAEKKAKSPNKLKDGAGSGFPIGSIIGLASGFLTGIVFGIIDGSWGAVFAGIKVGAVIGSMVGIITGSIVAFIGGTKD